MQSGQSAGAGAAPAPIDQMVQALTLHPTFTRFDGAALRALATRSGIAAFAAGDLIISQGDPGSFAYLILDGEVDVFVEIPGDRVQMATLGRHNMIGELGAFTDMPRTATVTAETSLLCWGLAPWDFRPLVENNATVAWKLLDSIAKIVAES